MYGFTDDQVKTKKNTPIEMGVEVGPCKLTECKYVSGEKNGKKWKAVEFSFKKGDASLRHTLFEQTNIRPLPNETQEQATTRVSKNFNTILKDIAIEVGTDQNDLKQISGSSFEEVVKSYCDLVNKNNTNDIWLKIGKNRSGYNELCTGGRFIAKFDPTDTTGPGFVYTTREENLINLANSEQISEDTTSAPSIGDQL
jgi:hypothetical protein